MKKRIFKIMATAIIMSLLLCQGVFAAGLEVVSVYPEDGGTGYETVNMMARIVFNGDVSSEINDSSIKIIGPDKKAKSILVLHPEETKEQINIVLKEALDPNEEYKIVIDKGLADAEGNTLGKEATYSFKTKDPGKDSLVTAIMMGVMMAAIMVITIRAQSKQHAQQDKDDAAKGKPKKVNPYKDTKTGKENTGKKPATSANKKADNKPNKNKKK